MAGQAQPVEIVFGPEQTTKPVVGTCERGTVPCGLTGFEEPKVSEEASSISLKKFVVTPLLRPRTASWGRLVENFSRT